jgi:hypothetical protein
MAGDQPGETRRPILGTCYPPRGKADHLAGPAINVVLAVVLAGLSWRAIPEFPRRAIR